jgi:hypothetical protein
MKGFADTMITSFPASLPPPDPLVRLFWWLEDSAPIHVLQEGQPCALLNPDDPNMAMLTEPVDPKLVEVWTRGDPEASRRLAPFVRTGSDGSYAALWSDDQDTKHIVHLGSGSGSVMLCTLTSDPVGFLQLLAIGYDELCWPEDFEMTPEEVLLDHGEEPSERPHLHDSPLRQWVESTFGVSVPRTASEIVARTASMDDSESDDPFWLWMRSLDAAR